MEMKFCIKIQMTSMSILLNFKFSFLKKVIEAVVALGRKRATVKCDLCFGFDSHSGDLSI